MLDSDAPKPISDNVYIPQDRQRKVNESEETSDEGGSFSFVFYDKKKQQTKEKTNKEPAEIEDPVKLKLSSSATPEETEKTEPVEPQKDNKETNKNEQENNDQNPPPSGSGGHINITV
jgi:hypothetical protein